ncbi:hypothetical protein NQ315_007624 [Exocentrus adspersus]|uniref:Nose resistant-to-fluoxetine protein N-terminal domain-containing protein n=1 Tax=Exocentrus adspersus TaxID=1586481 RepID=A0AAV8W802_9CUCU|nr:hypothetical protein NQ315_007624 [Exocentrus adspersus]
MKLLTFCIFAIVVPCSYQNNVFEVVLKVLKNRLEDIVDKSGVKSQCGTDLKILLRDLIRRRLWALQMLDASGKPGAGLLAGNIYVMGNFDECLNIHEENNNTIIDGQYCTVTVTPGSYANDVTSLWEMSAGIEFVGLNLGTHTKNIIKLVKVTHGVCIPASCTVGNLQDMWNYMEHTFRIPFHVALVDTMCRNRDKPVEPYFVVDTIIMIGFGIYIFILLISTLYDLLIQQNSKDEAIKEQMNYLTAFSVYHNAKKLFSYTHNSEWCTDLKCLSGIKVLSMLWIIFGHRVMVNMFFANVNTVYIFQWLKSIEHSPVIGGFLAVDTFFVLSGLLLSYVFLKTHHLFKKGMPVLLFYMYRMLRLIPALLAGVLFNITVFKNLGDGPGWPLIAGKVSLCCYKTWWATLFFISNFLPLHHQCIEQSWYLSVDTQLYIISPVILKNLLKSPKKTILYCVVACLVSAVYSFVITLQNGYGAVYYEADAGFYQYIYHSTFVRMPPWLIGIVMGYLIFNYQQITIPKCISLLTWIFSLTVMTVITLAHVLFTRNDYDSFRSAVYNAAARPGWALAVALIVFLCVTGHGGFINRFLSLPVFQVLVRLSYSMFLVHCGLLLYFIGTKKNTGVHDFIGDIFFIFLAATAWCLAFETPFLNIGKILIEQGRRSMERKEIEFKEISPKRKKKNRKNVVCLYGYEDKKKTL